MSVTEVLQGKGVTSITMIDDAFDPVSAMVGVEEIRAFGAELEQNEQLIDALAKLGIHVATINDVNDQTLQQLFDAQKMLVTFEAVLVLFGRATQVRGEAEQIKKNLEELDLIVTAAGKTTQLAKSDCKIYFLDYYLGPLTQPAEAVASAVARATAIYAQHPDPEPKPVIVLMSSNPLTDQQVTGFRKASGLLGGMFQHIPKAQLIDKNSLERKLLAVAKSFPVAHAIEALIASVENSFDATRDVIFSALRDLSLEDYIYIQRLSLKEDGQPLGDYLLWLFISAVVKHVFESEAVAQHQLIVDKLPMFDLPARQLSPSNYLAEMYRSALFKITPPDVEPHPLSTADKNYPLLSLGDIFMGSDTKLLMVLNAECDLAFAPQSKGRLFSPSKTVTMIRGTLFPLSQSLPTELKDKPRTELFVHGGETFQIVWDTKRIVTKEYGDMREWIDSNRLKRNYRLRLLYALQVQHAFTSDFGRIGPPTAPPIFSPLGIEVWSSNANGRSELVLGPLQNASALITLHSESTCAVDLSFLEQFCSIVPSSRQKLQQRRDAVATPPDTQVSAPAPTPAGPAPATPPGSQVPLPAPGRDTATTPPNGQIPAPAPGADDAARAEKRAKKLDRFDKMLKVIDEFLDDKVAQIDLISNPFRVPERDTAETMDGAGGLFCIYNSREVERNYQVDEPFIIRLVEIESESKEPTNESEQLDAR